MNEITLEEIEKTISDYIFSHKQQRVDVNVLKYVPKNNPFTVMLAQNEIHKATEVYNWIKYKENENETIKED